MPRIPEIVVKRETEPAELPLSLERLKDHLSIPDDDDDGDLGVKLEAATRTVEELLEGSLTTTGWALWLDADAWGDHIDLPRGPLVAISAVKYYLTDNTEQTWAAANYFADLAQDRLVRNLAGVWPTDLRSRSSLKVEYTAGYGTAGELVPSPIREAIAKVAGELFVNREVTASEVCHDPKFGIMQLLGPFRRGCPL